MSVLAEMEMCGLDPCQPVAGNWFMLLGCAVVIWLVWRYAP